jgi:hypothetical protein
MAPEITEMEVKLRSSSMPDYYVRSKDGACYDAANFYEVWQHFISDDGYRISFPVAENYQMTIWRKPHYTPEEIAEENAATLELMEFCNENAELLFQEDGKATYQFPDGKTLEFYPFLMPEGD